MSVQNLAQYTAADHAVWNLLYHRQSLAVRESAYAPFYPNLGKLGFSSDRIPDFGQINKNLLELTGWKIYAVPGLIPNRSFFELMSGRRFGATTWIRKMEEIEYLEEPDMFHDLFGHIPLLADPAVADFLHRLAMVAEKWPDDEEKIEAIARVYWYTIEFGLVKEGEKTRIYGAGILSSIGETHYCLSADANRVPFDLQRILLTPYIKDKYQEQYFVLDSMDQLQQAVTELDGHLSGHQKINPSPR
jgi:phenylalanine-4-hydroxylase